MENGPKIKKNIYKKMHFSLDFLYIQDHFIIVIWQKYLLLSDLINRFLLTEVPFLAYPNILKIAVFIARDSIFCSSQQTTSFENKQIFPSPVQEAVFFIRKFQSIV